MRDPTDMIDCRHGNVENNHWVSQLRSERSWTSKIIAETENFLEIRHRLWALRRLDNERPDAKKSDWKTKLPNGFVAYRRNPISKESSPACARNLHGSMSRWHGMLSQGRQRTKQRFGQFALGHAQSESVRHDETRDLQQIYARRGDEASHDETDILSSEDDQGDAILLRTEKTVSAKARRIPLHHSQHTQRKNSFHKGLAA